MELSHGAIEEHIRIVMKNVIRISRFGGAIEILHRHRNRNFGEILGFGGATDPPESPSVSAPAPYQRQNTKYKLTIQQFELVPIIITYNTYVE